MGLYLILAATASSWLIDAADVTLKILVVIFGVGFVIFVHELGHFLVAKLCGVKCEKFYLGFDIFGWKLAKFRWGETEYGIGALPFGGYVKMLGQEDNPARLREELERAKALHAQAGEGSAPNGAQSDAAGAATEDSEPIDLAAAERALYDPRSYLAKSVPQRMAIISAGVVMNVIFAFILAVVAFLVGVREIAVGVGAVAPGAAAWRANVHVGDQIKSIAGRPLKRFIELQQAVQLDDAEGGIPIVLDRPGKGEIRATLTPDQTGLAPSIGVANPRIPVLADEMPFFPGTPAAEAKPPLKPGDEIVAVDGEPIHNFADLHRQLALKPDQPLRLTIRRAAAGAAQAEQINVQVDPMPMRWLGLGMEMGPIVALQAESPAERAGLKVGDTITAIDADGAYHWDGDPMTLPEQLRRLALKTDRVTVTVVRKGAKEPVRLAVGLRQADWYDTPYAEDSPISAPSLGVAYQVLPTVRTVEPGSEAAKLGVRPGDRILSATIIPPDAETLQKYDRYQREFTVDLSGGEDTWPFLSNEIQEVLPGTRVELTLAGGRTVELVPIAARHWYYPDRGFVFQPQQFDMQADSFPEAVALGAQETYDSLTVVVRSINSLRTGRVSPRLVAGPLRLLAFAYLLASQGPGKFLLFLTLLSANLAVLNFLPIPILDGGHMVFLAYEGIRRRPPNVQVQSALSLLGLVLIVALMVWALGNDILWFVTYFFR